MAKTSSWCFVPVCTRRTTAIERLPSRLTVQGLPCCHDLTVRGLRPGCLSIYSIAQRLDAKQRAKYEDFLPKRPLPSSYELYYTRGG